MPRRFCHATPMSSVANISAYKFVSLDGLPELRETLLARARGRTQRHDPAGRGRHQPVPGGRVRRHRVFPGRAARGCALRRPGAEVQLQRRGAVPQAAGEDQARDHPHEPSGHPPRGRSRAGGGRAHGGALAGAGRGRCRSPGCDAGHAQRLRGRRGHVQERHRLAHRALHPVPGRGAGTPRRAARQDRGQLLHRRHPLRRPPST